MKKKLSKYPKGGKKKDYTDSINKAWKPAYLSEADKVRYELERRGKLGQPLIGADGKPRSEAIEYVPVESALLPANLPIQAASRLGKAAVFGAEVLNPIGGFKNLKSKNLTSSVDDIVKNTNNQLPPPPSEIQFMPDGTTRTVYNQQPITQNSDWAQSWGTENWNPNSIDLRRPINGFVPGTPEWDRLNSLINEGRAQQAYSSVIRDLPREIHQRFDLRKYKNLDLNELTLKNPSLAEKIKSNLKNLYSDVKKTANQANKKIGEIIDEKLYPTPNFQDVIQNANENLKKGMGVAKEKTNISLKPSSKNTVDVYIDDIKTGNLYLPSTKQPRSLSDILSGKPVQDYPFAKSKIVGFRKYSDFPFINLSYEAAAKYKTKGISGEINKSISEALKNKGSRLYSGGSGHTNEGFMRYQNLLSKGLVEEINPNIFMYKKNGGYIEYPNGGTFLTAGNEYHRIYKNADGDIMVNHPKEDKGKWDTINLTDKAGAKTVADGVAATKKWHRENPYGYGGSIFNYPDGGDTEKYYPSGKIEGEKSKEEYINYLKSRQYFLTASQKWGAAKAQQLIDRQIEDVKNTPIEYWKDMEMQNKIDYLQDPSLAGYHKIEDKIFNYDSKPEYDIHELSHSTDSNIRNLPKDVFSIKSLYNDRTGSYQGKKYIFNRKYIDDDTIAEKVLNINPNYSEYNKFQQYGDDNLEYLSKPTEVRARVNTLRNNLIKNNINYHNLTQQQFEDYLNKNITNVDYNINSPVRIDNFKTNENPFEQKVIPYQQQNLEELKIGIGDKKPLLDVLKLYGSTNKSNMSLPIATYGGLINNTMKKRTLSKTVYKYGGKLPQHGTGATVGSLVGAGIGALLAPATGGTSLLLGASLGSSLGSSAGSLAEGFFGSSDSGPDEKEMQRKQNIYNEIKYGPKQENPYVDVTQKNFNFPYGGVIDEHMANPNAELELEETFQTPDGTVGRVDGPSHDNGGIEVNLPEGTKIFSDRLKYKNGRTYAQITKPITTKIAKLEKKLQDNPQDVASANTVYLLNQQLDHYFDDQETNKSMKEMKRTLKMANGGMIKRADGSYSRRGLWDNIRANKGSGKKPTKEMLEQERKIKAQEKAMGGYMYAEGGINNPGFRALPEYVQEKIIANMEMGGYMYPIGGKLMNDPMFAEGGKLPKEVLMPRLQAHMSPAEVEEYLDEYGSGGYTVRKTNERKGKTHVVIGPDGTKKYFGDPKMGEKGKSKYGKEAFYARHKKNLDKNPYFRAYARATWQEGGTIGEEGMNQEPLFEYKDGGIYIKPENRGKFTAYAKAHGKGVQEMASHIMANKEDYSPTLVKRANFARNAAKWKHEHGGYLPMYFDGDTVGNLYNPAPLGEVNMDELDLSGLGETTTPATRDFSNVDDTTLFGSPTFKPTPNLSGINVKDNPPGGPTTKPESWASRNMGTIGQVGAGLAGAALRAYNLSKVKAPEKLSNLDFSSSMYNPDLVDYSANINAANRSAISAMDEAQRGFGSSAAAQAFKNKARLNQLETTGKIYQGQENVNKQLLNEARQRNQQVRMQEQAANQDIARQNMENAYNYNVWKQQQKNQIIQDLIGTTGDVFGGMQKFRNDTEMANILAKARENEVNIDALPEEVQLSYFRSLSPDQQATFNQKRARLGRTTFEFGGMIRKFPNGGSIGNQYKQSLQTVVNQPTIDKSALMDAEYTAALQAGKDKYKSSVTGLDYKVLPKAEKRALVVDMWRDLHGKAPNQKEIESGVKAIEGKKVSSEKAKEVKQALSSQDYAAGINKVWQPANLTKQEQMMYAQEEVQRDKNKVIETLNFYSPAAARYYRETGDLQGALDNFVAPDRFDVSSGAAGYSIGKAVKEGDMSGLDMLNLGLLAASGVNAMQRGPKPLGPKLPEYFENIKRNTELAKQKSGVGKNSYKSKQNKANEARLENWQENVSEDFKSKKQSPEFQSKLSKRIALEEDENLGLDIMDYKLNKQEVPKFVQLKLKEMEKDLIKAKNSGNYQEWAKIKKEIEKYISSEQKKRSLKK